MLFVKQYFVKVSLEARGELDIKILGAWLDVKHRALRFNAVVLDSVKLGVLEKAHGLLQQSSGNARAGGIVTNASSGAAALAGSEGVARGGEARVLAVPQHRAWLRGEACGAEASGE